MDQSSIIGKEEIKKAIIQKNKHFIQLIHLK